MESIDLLLQANRFNILLLGVIPAIVIVTVATKIAFRALFNLRAKDIRPISVVHSEMSEYLNDMESILLLSDHGRTGEPAKMLLKHEDIGEFSLIMHNYLALLDYSNPPLPSWHCDAIHRSMQEFLGSQGSMTRLSVDDQIRLIDQIKRKHRDVSRYL